MYLTELNPGPTIPIQALPAEGRLWPSEDDDDDEEEDDEDDDDYTNRNNDGDDGETLLEKFGNKICRQCCRGNPIKSDFEIFEHRAFQTFVWGKASK